MDIDSSQRRRLKRLMEEERERMRKEGRCYKCWRTGHIARNCPTRQLVATNSIPTHYKFDPTTGQPNPHYIAASEEEEEEKADF